MRKIIHYVILIVLILSIQSGYGQNNRLKWIVTPIQDGIQWYSFNGFVPSQNAHQIINALIIDLNKDFNVSIINVNPTDSLSSVATKNGAIVGINGTYESDASFVKFNDSIHASVKIPQNHLRYWKHEGAFYTDSKNSNHTINFGLNDSYIKSGFPNIISGAPMLIDNYKPVGSIFIGNTEGLMLDSLEYEDYRRHQGVRHPRTAVALTRDDMLILITVDGRRKGVSEGMSAKELTEMLQDNFNPKSALNIDGGGSTTMWIKNQPFNGVVNYPTDNKKLDHYGQRKVRSFILIKETFIRQ